MLGYFEANKITYSWILKNLRGRWTLTTWCTLLFITNYPLKYWKKLKSVESKMYAQLWRKLNSTCIWDAYIVLLGFSYVYNEFFSFHRYWSVSSQPWKIINPVYIYLKFITGTTNKWKYEKSRSWMNTWEAQRPDLALFCSSFKIQLELLYFRLFLNILV